LGEVVRKAAVQRSCLDLVHREPDGSDRGAYETCDRNPRPLSARAADEHDEEDGRHRHEGGELRSDRQRDSEAE
jgi:hypothetical protein